jgi:acetyl-CoA synthetase
VEGVVWTPSAQDVEGANVTRLMRAHGIADYDELVRRSIEDIGWFWDAVIHDLDIEFFEPYRDVFDTGRGVEWTTWFTGATVNLVHQCVDRWAARTPEGPAVIGETEDGSVRTWTYQELRRQTDRLARGLRSLGVGARDTVGIFLPMIPEAVAAVMACSKIGAIWVPIFSGFGPDAVAARLADARVRVLITADGSLRKGQRVRMKATADRAAEIAGSVERIVVVRRLSDPTTPWQADRDAWWDDLADDDEPLPSEPLEAEHPLFIGYTSGTTGKPKGVLHVHGGFLVKIAEEVAYQVDLHRGDVLHWATDLGWIMGPWEIVGVLALGSTVLLFEGAPTHPAPDRLWSLVERHRVTTLGVSPTLIRALVPAGDGPVREHDLSSLRILASTGEPWDPSSYGWLSEHVGGGRLPIINLSGGTEVGACFLSPTPVCALKPLTLYGPALGMAMEIRRSDGSVADPNEVGELVCTKPWPSMTRGIWGDPDRYLQTYWSRWASVWVHGDWAVRDEDGFWFLRGRSDDTLNIAGKRIGPAEVESAIALHPGVAESAAVGMPDEVKGEQVWCFVVAKPGMEPDPEELRRTVGDHLGKSFAPARIVLVPELPKTRSAKIVRRAIRAAAMGQDPGDLSSVENPQALDAIRESLTTG